MASRFDVGGSAGGASSTPPLWNTAADRARVAEGVSSSSASPSGAGSSASGVAAQNPGSGLSAGASGSAESTPSGQVAAGGAPASGGGSETGSAAAAPAGGSASSRGVYGFVVTFFDALGQEILDANLRAAGYDPDVERFHRAMLAQDPSLRLAGAPTGDADKDCVQHDVWDPDGNQAKANQLAARALTVTTAMGFAGGKVGGGKVGGEMSTAKLLARVERRPLPSPQECVGCMEKDPLGGMWMILPGPRRIRTIAPGEKVTALLDELEQRTRATGNEHGIFSLTSGERILVEGGPNSIALPANTLRIIAHTHPTGTRFASQGDQQALSVTGRAGEGQQHSYIVVITKNGKEVRRFDKPKQLSADYWDALIENIHAP